MDPDLTYLRATNAFNSPDVDVVTRFDEKGYPYMTTVPVPKRTPAAMPQRPVEPAPMVVYTPGQPDYGPSTAPSTYNPLRDPIVMRLLSGAVAIGASAIALSFALAALAAAELALGLLLGVLVVLWAMTSGRGSGGKPVNHITINNTNKSRRWR